VKDFVKKVKLEDNRIEMRKKSLARVTERQLAAQEEKPQVESDSKETPASVDASAPTAVASALHPSLPPRPLTAVQPTQVQSATTPISNSTTTQAPAPVVSVKKTEPLDPQIAKFEEVRLLLCWRIQPSYNHRTNKDGLGLHFGQLAINIYSTLAELAPVTLHSSYRRLRKNA